MLSKHKKKSRLLILIFLFILIFSSFLLGILFADPIKETAAGLFNEEKIENIQAETIEQDPTVKGNYSFNPHVLSKLYLDLYGEEFESVFYSFCDAILNYKDSFYCPDETYLAQLENVANSCFPLYSKVATLTFEIDSNSLVHLNYLYPQAEHQQIVSDFETCITNWLNTSLEDGDAEFVKTLCLYTSFSSSMTYDKKATEFYNIVDEDGDSNNDTTDTEVELPDVSPYRALTQKEGICQSFAPAYTYLLLQAGVDAVDCGGLSYDETQSHDWTLVTLNNTYYYMDTTFENSDSNGTGLYYFAMTTDKRVDAGDWNPEYFNVGNTNEIWGYNIEVNDDYYSPLWEVTSYTLDRENHQILYKTINNEEYSFSYE